MSEVKIRKLTGRVLNACDTAGIATSLAIAAASAGSLFKLLMGASSVKDVPTQLLGCFAYTWEPIGIANRLFTVGVSVFVAVAVTMILLVLLSRLDAERRRQTAYFTLLAFVPVFLQMATGGFNVQTAADLSWVHFSLALSMAALCLQFRRDRSATGDEFILLFESFFIPYGFYMAVRSVVFWLDPGSYMGLVAWVRAHLGMAPYVGLLLCLIVLLSPKRDSASGRSTRTLVLQLLAVPLFAVLVPEAYQKDAAPTVLHATGPVFAWLVLPVLLIAIADIVCRHVRKGIFGRKLSPFPLIAILAIHHYRQFSIMGLSNFYEYGDRISAYAAIRSGALVCFRDVAPTYGIWDWLQLRFAEFFGGGTLTMADTFGEPLMVFLVVAFSFCVFYHLLPVALAFLLSYFVGGWAAAFLAAWVVLWIHPSGLRPRTPWCAGWAVSACFLFFFRVPQGAMLVLSFLPLFAVQFVQCFRLERAHFVKLLAFLLAVGALMLVWPLAPHFYGLARIFLETGSINSAWAASSWVTGTGNPLALLAANAVLLLPALALALAAALHRAKETEELRVPGVVAFGVVAAAFVYMAASHSYSFSRFDDLYSRQYQTWVCLLPLVVCPAVWLLGTRDSALARFLLVFVFATLASVDIVRQRPAPSSPERLMTNPMQTVYEKDMDDGRRYGLPSLGRGYAPPGVSDELRAEGELKRVLDKVLDPDETFLNLSLNGALYYALGRTLPWRHTNYYNVTGDRTQAFMLRQLAGKKIGATVFGRQVYDHSYPMIRSRHLFRHAVTNALPYKVNDRYFVMMAPDRFARLGRPAPDVRDALSVWDDFYNDESDLYRFNNLIYAPSVWGRNAKAMVAGRAVCRQVSPVSRVDERHARVSFGEPLSGRTWGIMVIDAESECWAGCRWKNEFGESRDVYFKLMPGANVVPLDAYPRWLLASSNEEIIFFSQDRPLNLRAVSLYSSKGVE